MPDVFSLEPDTRIDIRNSYILSYPYIRNYFASKVPFDAEDLVCGAHMVYGWMPTALDLYPHTPNIDLEAGARLLTKARLQGSLEEKELKNLSALVNNSVVGASKLLHFVAPTSFAIWDSKIYKFLAEQAGHHYRVNDVGAYLDYLRKLETSRMDMQFPGFHKSVNRKLGYDVSGMRALELIMFLNAPA